MTAAAPSEPPTAAAPTAAPSEPPLEPSAVPTELRPTRIVVDLVAIRDNVRHLRARTAVEVCAVVKADGYGHGALAVARAALDGGATWLAVALVEEGMALRVGGVAAPILVLSEPPLAAVPALLDAGLTPTVYRTAYLDALDAAGRARGRPIAVHVKVDTGMGRVGVPPAHLPELLRRLAGADFVTLEATYTHLARADEPDEPTTGVQLAAFDRALDEVAAVGLAPGLRHVANTAGALLHPASRHDLVRAGIGIYGLSPAADVDAAAHGLQPALSLVSEVSFAKHVTAGTEVSYGHRWRAPRDGWIATVPLGYADGVPRALTNRAAALLRGRRRSFAGTVTMDQLLLWCDATQPSVGEEVVLLGRQGDEQIRVEEWAALADTITYEIVTQLSARVPRHHRG